MTEILVYVDPDATGTPVTGEDWTYAYNSCAAAEAAEQADLVTDTDNIIFKCRNSADSDDPSYLGIGDWETSSDYDIVFQVEDAYRHDGTENSGYRINVASGNGCAVAESYVTIDGFEITSSDDGVGTTFGGNTCDITIKRCLIYDCPDKGIIFGPSQNTVKFLNNIIYNCGYGIYSTGQNPNAYAYNNTVYNCGSYGILRAVCKNNISMGHGTADFLQVQTGSDYNCSDDATATGSNSIINQTAADIFTNVTSGSEDLSLKTGSNAIDDGVDLGTTPTGVNIDAIGRDRDSEGDTWDMGAIELVVAGGSTLLPNELNQSQSIDNLDLIQQNILAIDSLNQSQSIDNIDLIQANIIVIGDLDQSQTIENLDLIQANIIVINDSDQNQTIENIDLIQQNLLSINQIDQNQVLDNLDLVQANILVINKIDQSQSIENLVLQTGIILQINDIGQSQTLDSLDLIQANVLAIGNIFQDQSIDNITLSVGVLLQIADIAQSQNIDVINLIQQSTISINDIEQVQTIDNIILDIGVILQIADIIQSQTIDNLNLSQANTLAINDLIQSQTIDTITFARLEGKVTITFVLSKPGISHTLSSSGISHILRSPGVTFKGD